MTYKRKITAVVLVIIAITPLACCLMLNIRQQNIRHRMKEKLESEITHTVIIPEKDLQWIEQGKELLINGRMFDVKHIIRQNNGKVILTGLFDNDETNLVKEIRTQQEKSRSEDYAQLVSLLQIVQVLPPDTNSSDIPVARTEPAGCPHKMNFLHSAYIGVSTPPPRC